MKKLLSLAKKKRSQCLFLSTLFTNPLPLNINCSKTIFRKVRYRACNEVDTVNQFYFNQFKCKIIPDLKIIYTNDTYNYYSSALSQKCFR